MPRGIRIGCPIIGFKHRRIQALAIENSLKRNACNFGSFISHRYPGQHIHVAGAIVDNGRTGRSHGKIFRSLVCPFRVGPRRIAGQPATLDVPVYFDIFSAFGTCQVFIFSRSDTYIRKTMSMSSSLRLIGSQFSSGTPSGFSAAT